MRLSWESALVVALLLALCLVVILGVVRQETRSHERGSTYAGHSEGTQALVQWLSQLGYTVRTLDEAPWTLPPDAHALLIIAPSGSFSQTELRRLGAWTQDGGTVIIAQDRDRSTQLLAHLGLGLARLTRPVERAALRLPALNWPSVGEALVRASRGLRLGRDDAAVHMGDCNTPLLVSWGQGAGQVFVISTAYPFTNAGLADEGNAQLVYNLVRAGAPPGGTVVFDEAHHLRPPAVLSLAWLVSRPEGWGLIYGGGLLFLYLLLSGRHFGAPLPVSARAAPRTSAEFVSAIASLQQRTGRSGATLRHYKAQLKRALAKPHRLDPTLPDEAFVAALGRCRDDVDLGALRQLMGDLSRERVSKEELVKLARQVAEWIP